MKNIKFSRLLSGLVYISEVLTTSVEFIVESLNPAVETFENSRKYDPFDECVQWFNVICTDVTKTLLMHTMYL